jgi:hypothetical protein
MEIIFDQKRIGLDSKVNGFPEEAYFGPGARRAEGRII